MDTPRSTVFSRIILMPASPEKPRRPKRRKAADLPVIGWREWAALPEFGIDRIKVKVDSGARSSSLHAFGLMRFRRNGSSWVRFQIHPVQRSARESVEVEAEVIEYRKVRSSNGKVSRRPAIVTRIRMMGKTWPIELTLASRDEMGFRMLLGREAVRKRFLIDTGSSYYAGKGNQPGP